MRPEDKYTAGIAGGAGLGLAGLGAYRYGRSEQAAGRAQARANAGSRGMQVRGGRLVRQGRDMQRSGQSQLSAFDRKVDGKGRTQYFQNGKFAPSKGPLAEIAVGQQAFESGRGMKREGNARRLSAMSGIKRMKTGRLVRRGGLAAMAAGAGAAVGSVALAERHRSKKTAARDSAVRAGWGQGYTQRKPAQQDASSASAYRSTQTSGGLLRNSKGERNYIPGKAIPASQRDYMRNKGLIDDSMSDAEVYDVLRRMRANGR